MCYRLFFIQQDAFVAINSSKRSGQSFAKRVSISCSSFASKDGVNGVFPTQASDKMGVGNVALKNSIFQSSAAVLHMQDLPKRLFASSSKISGRNTQKKWLHTSTSNTPSCSGKNQTTWYLFPHRKCTNCAEDLIKPK